jgi:hypothetical protein
VSTRREVCRPIFSPADLSPIEVAALASLSTWLLSQAGGKVLSRPLGSWERPPPPDVLMPSTVRAKIRETFAGLARAEELERFASARVKINGVPFRDWERDPTVMFAALRGGA